MIPQEHKTELTEILEKRGIYFTPSIEIRVNQLEKIPLIEFESNNHDGIYNKVRQAIKPVVNYNWDNNILRVTNISGNEFSIHIYLSKTKGVLSGWEITIWDYLGTTTIGVWKKKYCSDDDCLTIEEIHDIEKRLGEFSHNILHCNDCQSTIPSDKSIRKTEHHEKEYGGQYFTGHFCKDCWERKWRAVEAKENYN